MASSLHLVKDANNSEKLSVEGCASSIAVSSGMSHELKPTLTHELRNKVFGNDLIKDIIFDYVFKDSNGELSIKDVLTCRLVDKTWLDHASYRLRMAGSPQFGIDFEFWDVSRDQQKMRGKKNQVHKFLDTWTNVNNPDAGCRIPLFNLNFKGDTPNKGNKERWEGLMNILTNCANGLHSLDVRVSDYYSIWDKSPPTGKRPETLAKLEICTYTQLLEKLFLANSFPNLTKLLLNLPLARYENDVIFQILDRFRLQLKHFTLSVFLISEQLANINIPVMPNLEYMNVCCSHHKTLPRGQQCQPFPSLETLILTKQTSSTFASWMESFLFNSVKSLTVNIRSKNSIIFTLELSLSLHTSFPFLQELDISFGILQDCSIQNIFQRMVNLRKLSMRIMHTAEIRGSATWDAILVGVTPEYAANLASSRDQWDSINLNDRRVPSHSIINLTDLESLTLNADNLYGDFELIISDVSFRFAFLCMPKLHELTFRGKFGASNDIDAAVESKRQEDKLFLLVVYSSKPL